MSGLNGGQRVWLRMFETDMCTAREVVVDKMGRVQAV